MTTSIDRLGLTLFVAVTLHATVILGVSFTLETPEKPATPDRTLEIMVVQNPQKHDLKQPIEKADFLAQASQEGGGDQTEKMRPTTEITPSTPLLRETSVQATAPPPPPAPKPKAEKPKKVLTKQQPDRQKIETAPEKRPTPPEKRRVTAAQLLASTNQEIARLTAELDEKTKAYAKRPRRKTLSARTQEYKYASYLDAWRRKVERVGNLNYPDEAKRRKLYGNLVLHVEVRADGSVKTINVRQSSGHKLLDDAAIRIVKLSSPFAPFPAEIRKETDILDIIRTWQFRNNDQLFSK
ncbi:energy transducer TonB [Sedimenticola hydrogenitrophicus]|uniref:energy transducer TonB n=1 Tax=Sedimenticola hydrogenitrophicus TaxID=2967975 RepID=UPI0021A3FC79|nr:TonB family protein [Sedimenticola hydrogenitrophicus]